MRVRLLPALFIIGLLSVPAPVLGTASDATDGEECSTLVCAESRATISSSCTQGIDPYTGQAFLACTLRFIGTAGGSSPALLPGDVMGSGKAQVDWSCTASWCEPKRVRDDLEYATYWVGGPDSSEAGTASGGSRTVEVARITISIGAPPGTVGVCLDFEATLHNEAVARVPRLDPPLPAATLDEAFADDHADHDGNACFE